MTELILDCALDALKDGALSIPILFLAYLLMEMLENSKRLDEGILHSYSRKAGPALGGLLGAIPQCGISGAAATLFSTGSISVGTMLAVFFATSDEMLPVMLSSLADGKGATDIGQIAAIVAAKAVMGIVLGSLSTPSAVGSSRGTRTSTASASVSTASAMRKRAACGSRRSSTR